MYYQKSIKNIWAAFSRKVFTSKENLQQQEVQCQQTRMIKENNNYRFKQNIICRIRKRLYSFLVFFRIGGQLLCCVSFLLQHCESILSIYPSSASLPVYSFLSMIKVWMCYFQLSVSLCKRWLKSSGMSSAGAIYKCSFYIFQNCYSTVRTLDIYKLCFVYMSPD